MPPPITDEVLIETTDGKTLWAIPATESGARSITLLEETKVAPLKIEAPVAVTPKKPPTLPASKAIKTMLPLAGFCVACHHGAGDRFFLRGKIIGLVCYNFVASNNPSPTGSIELTQCSVSFLMIFPASRRATVRGSRCAASGVLPPPK